MNTPFLLVVAGPNGVGKSTFAEWYLQLYPDCIMIVDPDAIARELHYVRDEERQIKAARIAIERINLLIEQRISFAIETTMSGRTLASNLHRARSEGYYIAIVLLWVPSVRITAERVEMRVASGGHDIPLMDQLRRFDRSYINFSRSTKDSVMNGDFLTEYLSQPKKSPQEVVDSLKTDLLSDDVERSKLAAALIRMSLSISERARIHGTKIVTMIDGEVRHLDPDSPLIPDVSVLLPFVDEMYPLRDDRVANSR